MKRFFVFLNVCLVCINMANIIYADQLNTNRPTIQPFQIGQYKKAIVSDNILYMNDAQHVSKPNHGSLIIVPLSQSEQPQKIRSYFGVNVSGGSLYPYRTLPFCWDIVEPYFLAIESDDLPFKHPMFALVRMPLRDIPQLLNLHETKQDLFQAYGLSNLYPLADLFDFAPVPDRMRMFFDLLPLDHETFHLYLAFDGMMTVWENDKDVHATMLTTDWNAVKDPFALQKIQEKSWFKRQSFPVDFEGPFWVFQIREQTYLFSEVVRQIYRIGEQELLPIAELPPLLELSERSLLDMAFVVDKDTDEALFFLPSLDQPEDPTLLSIGGSHSQRRDILPALKTALELYTMPEE